jgi:hypothetical protein
MISFDFPDEPDVAKLKRMRTAARLAGDHEKVEMLSDHIAERTE